MNPFAKTASGLFVVIGPKTASPLQAEQVCAAIIDKLRTDPATNLAAQNWQNVVEMIPNQVENLISTRTQQYATPDELSATLAKICSVSAKDGQAPADLATPLVAYLNRYGEPTSFNCLILDQSNPAQIDLRLTCLNVTDAPGNGKDNFAIASTMLLASLNLSNKPTAANLQQIFGGYAPPADAPYYLRIVR